VIRLIASFVEYFLLKGTAQELTPMRRRIYFLSSITLEQTACGKQMGGIAVIAAIARDRRDRVRA